jgi:NAD(P)-dependent dehydrogenase (short-subunit alcohol dehydrogenase family)
MPRLLVFGARGLGRAIAEHLMPQGWEAVGVARSQDTADAFPGTGVVADLTDPGRMREVVASAAPFDLAVNAVSPKGRFGGGDLTTTDDEAMAPYLEQLLPEVFAFYRICGASLAENGRGTLVQVTGGSARREEPPVTWMIVPPPRSISAAPQSRKNANDVGSTCSRYGAIASSSVVTRSPPPKRPLGETAFTARSNGAARSTTDRMPSAVVASAAMPVPGNAAAVSSVRETPVASHPWPIRCSAMTRPRFRAPKTSTCGIRSVYARRATPRITATAVTAAATPAAVTLSLIHS